MLKRSVLLVVFATVATFGFASGPDDDVEKAKRLTAPDANETGTEAVESNELQAMESLELADLLAGNDSTELLESYDGLPSILGGDEAEIDMLGYVFRPCWCCTGFCCCYIPPPPTKATR